MRLISCYIHGFGGMKKAAIEFDDNYSEIIRGNGWGKSTLSAFIRVMFYGFNGENKRNDIDNERKRYRPWTGDGYGGEIVFELGGRRYRLQRTFGMKKSEDVFALYDAVTNIKSSDFSDDIGEEIFQIDSESFVRTVFIGQDDLKTGTTDDINAKIGNLEDRMWDLGNYEDACSRLKNVINTMSPGKKNGQLYREGEDIRRVRELVRTYPQKQKRLDELNDAKKRIIHDMAYSKDKQEVRVRNTDNGHHTDLKVILLCIIAAMCMGIGIWMFVDAKIRGAYAAALIIGGIIMVIIAIFKKRRGKTWDSDTDQEKTADNHGDDMRLEELETRLAECTDEIAEIRGELRNIRDIGQQLEGLEKAYARKTHEYELVKYTYEFLNEAKAKFTSRYATPVWNAFDRYYTLVTGSSADDFQLDANLNVYYKGCGAYRDIEFMSTGQNDIINLCMRAALMDVMYPNEKPFVIMDDPFVNMDDDSLDGAKRLMEALTESYQVIYFTCSESRRITL